MNALQPALRGTNDAFVAKLNSAGSALIYSTYFGGTTTFDSGDASGLDNAFDIAVDSGGSAYIVGETQTIDFPVTPNAFQQSFGGIGAYEGDAYVAKFNAGGDAVVYSTYLGGSHGDSGKGIAVEASGSIYVTGQTASVNFPVANAFQPVLGNTEGIHDAFITKLNPDGASLSYSTYLGSSFNDSARAIAADAGGNAYVTGGTNSDFFPVRNAIQGTLARSHDAFVTKLAPQGSALIYSTFLGSVGNDVGNSIAVDGVGDAYVVGSTTSRGFPTANPARAIRNGEGDGFASKIHVGEDEPTYQISGRVFAADGSPLAGVDINLFGGARTRTITSGDGSYSFRGLRAGVNYSLTAYMPCASFTTQNDSINNLSSDRTVDFNGSIVTYGISGRVTNSAGTGGLGGVKINLSGGRTATTTTSGDGNYSFPSVPGCRDYTLTPEARNVTFGPPSRSYTYLSMNQGFADFSGTVHPSPVVSLTSPAQGATYDVSASVPVAADAQAGTGRTISKVEFYLGDEAGNNLKLIQTDTVAPYGGFNLTNQTEGGYSIYAYAYDDGVGVGFSAPVFYFVKGKPANVSVGGRVADAANNSLAGVTVTLGGSQSATTTTDAGGNYAFNDLAAGGNYSVTPSLANYTFSPASLAFNDVTANRTADFNGSLNTFTIGGQIKDNNDAPLPGATVTLSGAQNATTTTDAGGNYSFAGITAGGNYVVTPSLANHTFVAPSSSFNNLSANRTANFTGTRNMHGISGRVADGANNALAGVTLNLTGARTASVVSDVNGGYSFANLPAGGNYTVTASRANYTFAPATFAANNLSGDHTANFNGTLNRHVISGRVTDGVNGVNGVTVTLGGAQAATVSTDASGNYSFANLPAGASYTVTLSKPGYTFAPLSRVVDGLAADRVENFMATLEKYEIRGRVVNVSNNGMQNITVTLSGARNATALTDVDGHFSFSGLDALGSYTVTASATNYSFEQAGHTFNSLTANQSVSFLGRLNTYTVGGRVTDGAGRGVAGITLTLSGAQSGTATTDASGNYSFVGLPAGGNYTLTATGQGYSLAMPARTINALAADRTESFIAIPLYFVAGKITTAGGEGLGGVRVALEGLEARAVETDASGNYSFANIPAGQSVTLTPEKPNYVFSLSKQTVVVDGNKPNVNFTAAPSQSVVQFSAASYQANEGDARATVTVVRTGNTSVESSFTLSTRDEHGGGSCVEVGSAASSRCDYAEVGITLTFASGETQKTVTISLNDDAHVEAAETLQLGLLNVADPTALGAIYTASLTITDNDQAGAPNPIFTAPYFVRMQYLDFLSREPEADEPWSAVLNRCSDVNNNPTCDRLQVSASFFNSPEFRLKGFYVFKLYRVAFNRRPVYEEIIPDMRSVTGETPAEVYRKRAALPVNFTQRAEFKALYDTLSETAFVNALLDRYGLQRITAPDPSNPEGAEKVVLSRADLIGRLGASGTQALTRAQVLRAVVESTEVAAAEYNRAFVAMQYYGYLRRTPEEDGYQAWLRVINQDPNNVRLMVNGFMNSTEYRLRFGRP